MHRSVVRYLNYVAYLKLLLHHVSPTIEKKLNDLGIFHYWQIAGLGSDAARKIGEEVGLPGRVEGWIAQSKELSPE